MAGDRSRGRRMTREEAIQRFNGIIRSMSISVAQAKFYPTKTELDELCDMAIEALSAEVVQGWIPCSERLPEEEGWYLVTIQNDKTEKRRTENDLFAIGIAEAHKLTPNKFCKDGHRQTVIAWMPLPEPYKGGDTE